MKRIFAGCQLYRCVQNAVDNPTLHWLPSLNCKRTQCLHSDKRYFSSKDFDINQVVKQNHENKSLVGTKAVSKKTSQKRNKTQSDTKLASDDVLEDSQEESDVRDNVPDWFTFLLDTSYSGDVNVDSEKFQLFKDFVEDIELKALPSVGTVIKNTETDAQKKVLERWQKSKTKELGGEEQFKKYQKEILEKGISIHKCIELYLSGERDMKMSEACKGYFESVQGVLDEVEDVKLLEEELAHPHMFYRGKIDCLATYRGKPLLIEWKTSSILRPTLSNTYDNPVQVAAYMGALNKSVKLNKHGLPPITNALLVIMYADGEPATVHQMSPKICQRYWQRWQERVYNYWTNLYKHHQQL